MVGSIATTVKIMKWRRMLRLEARVTEEEAERGELPVRVETGIQTEFGVKALDEGSSIEGVWNAHTVTPLQAGRSRHNSPSFNPMKMFRRSRRNSLVSTIPPLDISIPSAAVPEGELIALPSHVRHTDL